MLCFVEWLPFKTKLWKLPVPLMLFTFLFLFVVELDLDTRLVTKSGLPWLLPVYSG